MEQYDAIIDQLRAENLALRQVVTALVDAVLTNEERRAVLEMSRETLDLTGVHPELDARHQRIIDAAHEILDHVLAPNTIIDDVLSDLKSKD